MGILLSFIPVHDGSVKRSSLEVLSHTRTLAEQGGHTVEAVLVGDHVRHLTDQVAAYGPQRIHTVEDVSLQHPLNAPYVAALERVIATVKPAVVTMASSEAVKDLLGALAVRTKAAVLPDVSAFELMPDGVTALRPVMAAKMLARTNAKGPLVLVSVRSGSYEAIEADAETVVEAIPFSMDESSLSATLQEIIRATSGAVDLGEARVVIAAGRGVRDEEGKALVEELAETLGAAIGASRAVVENGLFPATAQIGQTGKVVSPDLYFAIGISGAIQHVAGMSNSRVIVAINKDADAPIFDYATYGIVGDLFKVLPPLIQAIKSAKGVAA